MKHPTLLAFAALLLQASIAEAQTPSLSPQVIPGLDQFVARVGQGALGPDVIAARYEARVTDAEATLELHRKDGTLHHVALRYPDHRAAGSRPRFFSVVPEQGTPTDEVDRIGLLLDEVFPRNPWVEPWAQIDSGSEASIILSWRQELGVLLFLLLTLAGGLVAIVRADPGREAR